MRKSLKIKLISPRMSLRPMDSEFKRLMSPSLALVTLASLTPVTDKVKIEDENLRPVDFSDTPDLVGITVNVDTTQRAFDISKRYMDKGVKVIFGGIHASANPDDMLEHCDSVCIGEAEEIWEYILNDAANDFLQPKYYNPNVTNLEKFPLPEWHFADTGKYLYHNVIAASRGCPFKCEFCYNSCDYIRNPYRNRPVDHVINEIQRLGTRQILFIDDNLIGNIKWLESFIERIKPMNLTWHGAVSTNIVHNEALIDRMADSGCRSLFIGFESINHESLKSVNKRQNNIQNYEKLIKKLHSRDIMINASLVFGFDSDTSQVFPDTLDWLIENKVETMTAHILTPYPGTGFYKKLVSEGRIIDTDPLKYNTSKVVFQPKSITIDELQNGYLWMYEQFYSIKNIIRRRPESRKVLTSYFLFNLVYRKYGGMVSHIAHRFGLMEKLGRLARKLSYGID